ncbi:MAG: hypothetical protein JST32_10845 [Bacteroidetes bacterium]|nr:hypothetical protein [Bacteroidota bacterium]
MQRLLIILSCLCASHAIAQSDTARINVYDREGKFIECKLVVNKAKTRNLFLLKSVQKRDSARNYITRIYIGNKDNKPVAPVEIMMKFSQPIISVMPSYSEAFTAVIAISDDHTGYLFKVAQLNRDPGSPVAVFFMIKSKERITTEIMGLDGELK